MIGQVKGWRLKTIHLKLTRRGGITKSLEGPTIAYVTGQALRSWVGEGVTVTQLLKAFQGTFWQYPTLSGDKLSGSFRATGLSGSNYISAEAEFEGVGTRKVCRSCSGWSQPVIEWWGSETGLCCYNAYCCDMCFGCGNRSGDGGLCSDCYDALQLGRCFHCHNLLDREEVKGGLCVDCTLNGHLVNYSAGTLDLLSRKQRAIARAVLSKRGRPGLIGVELEVKARSLTTRLLVKDAVGEFAVLKSDSSIAPEGFEIVTLPMTEEEHYLRWQPVFQDVLSKCYLDSKCGLHAHLDRPPALVEVKILAFIADPDNQRFLDLWCGRMENEYCMRYVGRNLRDLKVMSQTEHHSAVARSSRNRDATLEFRMFPSTLSLVEFMGRLEFCDALTLFAYTHPLKEMKWREFEKWVKERRGFKFLLRKITGVPKGKKVETKAKNLLPATLGKLERRKITLPQDALRLVMEGKDVIQAERRLPHGGAAARRNRRSSPLMSFRAATEMMRNPAPPSPQRQERNPSMMVVDGTDGPQTFTHWTTNVNVVPIPEPGLALDWSDEADDVID